MYVFAGILFYIIHLHNIVTDYVNLDNMEHHPISICMSPCMLCKS